ncbi:MAG: hypothetical protein RQ751_02300 [Longimicrobiales bacterium]|nr:hypothetical protein [Longimicrobiales bacterium]
MGSVDVRQMRVLVAVELRRSLPPAFRTLLFMGGFAVILLLIGRLDADWITGLLVGSSFVYMAPVATNLLKDRADGGVEYVTSLPASPATLAAGRLVALAVLALAGALQATPGLLYGLHHSGVRAMLDPAVGPGLPAMAAGLFSLAFVILTTAGSVLVALGVRADPRTAFSGPILALMLVAVVSSELVERSGIDVAAHLTGFLARPQAPVVFLSGVLLLAGAVIWGAFVFTARSLERYEPVRDDVKW